MDQIYLVWLIILSILWIMPIILCIYIYKQSHNNYILYLKLRARMNKISDSGDYVSMKLNLKHVKKEPLVVDSSSLNQRTDL